MIFDLIYQISVGKIFKERKNEHYEVHFNRKSGTENQFRIRKSEWGIHAFTTRNFDIAVEILNSK